VVSGTGNPHVAFFDRKGEKESQGRSRPINAQEGVCLAGGGAEGGAARANRLGGRPGKKGRQPRIATDRRRDSTLISVCRKPRS